MSMTMVLVRVSADAFAALQRKPDYLQAILDDERFAPELGIDDDDIYSDLNYLGALRFCEENGLKPTNDDDDPVMRDLGVDGSLPYQATYGPAFSISPASARRATTSSLLITSDEDLQGWIAAAADQGRYVIGVVI